MELCTWMVAWVRVRALETQTSDVDCVPCVNFPIQFYFTNCTLPIVLYSWQWDTTLRAILSPGKCWAQARGSLKTFRPIETASEFTTEPSLKLGWGGGEWWYKYEAWAEISAQTRLSWHPDTTVAVHTVPQYHSNNVLEILSSIRSLCHIPIYCSEKKRVSNLCFGPLGNSLQ